MGLMDGESKYGNVQSNWYQTCNGGSSQDVYGRVINDFYVLKPRALNRARSKFITSMKENRQSSIGASLGEFDKTLRMIGDRAKQLLSFTRRLKRGNFRGAAAALGIVKPPFQGGWRPRAKEFGGAFLEYHFGWTPLLGDIHDGMRLISSPLPSDGRARGKGRAFAEQGLTKTYDSGGSLPTRKYLSGTFVSFCEIRGDTELVNPNLDLLESLGIANPVSVAWELVPFSFLVDHVVGIGDFLSSFSDELGWRCFNIGVSQLSSCRDGTAKIDNAIGGAFPYGTAYKTVVAVSMTRTLSVALPPHSLAFTNPFTGLSAPRASTYVALLLQLL
jgi:hypothetical protein